MTDIISTVLIQGLPTLGGVVIGYMWNKARGLSRKQKIMEAAMRCILKIFLRRLHTEAVAKGYISYEDENLAEEIYRLYHELGGNGQGTKILESIRELELRREK